MLKVMKQLIEKHLKVMKRAKMDKQQGVFETYKEYLVRT
jgi:hypothetical protein